MIIRISILLLMTLSFACSRKPQEVLVFEVDDFQPLCNWNDAEHASKDIKTIQLDYRNAIDGFVIPSEFQVEGGVFRFSFRIKNNSAQACRFLYKIYYQNESYKFQETLGNRGTKYNTDASLNFYGCSGNDTAGFFETELIASDGNFHEVKGSFRIYGNPRNEEKYFYEGKNERWRRNPRTGEYSFMLVVTTTQQVASGEIPDYISDISKKNSRGNFVNPFYFFRFGEGASLAGTKSLLADEKLKVSAVLPLDKGIFVSPDDFTPANYPDRYTEKCGYGHEFFYNAPLRQFVNYVDTSAVFYNIPVISNMLSDEYSMTEYNWNRTFFRKEELLPLTVTASGCPCEGVDADSATVSIINTAATPERLRKQSAGVITRHGFTYGKYTVKVKLSELLNRFGIWNGITNAIWLVSHSIEPWNSRSACSKEGYLPKYWGGRNEERSKITSYSEIDFEILKTVNYCPSYTYPPAYYYPVPDKNNVQLWNVPLPAYLLRDTANIMVCCTNWDMACPEPENYGVGCVDIVYGNQTFRAHRWDYWYRALTIKTPAPDDELFGSDFYYFQIEWKPEEIIWRIGRDKDQMRVVAYMNHLFTCIPDNQMLLVISQEFHSTSWWHGSPFAQGDIPFPARDYRGIIYEITVE